MKTKYALIALLAITFFGCDDNTAGLGLGMFPGSDQNINGKLTTFNVTTESVHAGEVYAMTNIGYVGKFTDRTFGTYEAGFLSELNCPENLTFSKVYQENSEGTKATGKLVTSFDNLDIEEDVKKRFSLITDDNGEVIGNCQINIYLWYSSYFGDSLTACRLSVYELDENLSDKDAYYTNIDPKEYYDEATGLLGMKAYTAVDLSVSDSVRNLSSYMPSVSIRLEKEKAEALGKKLFKSSLENGSDFYKFFPQEFKGIYVKSDYGDGTVLYINQVQMDIVSIQYATDSISGLKLKSKVNPDKDSIQYTGRSFASTREVIQANRLENDAEAIQKCINESKWTYLKSPAGIFTQASLPIKQIAEKLQGDTLNAVRLSIPIYNQSEDKKFGMSIPRSVLLIRKKYKESFFKNNQLSDGTISSLFDQSSTSGNLTEYTYNNITKLINNCLEDRAAAEKEIRDKGSITFQTIDDEGNTHEHTVNNITDWERNSEWDKVVLIPVLVTTDSSSSGYYGSSSNIIGIQHDLKPGYVCLKGGSRGKPDDDGTYPYPENVLKLEVVSTNFGSEKAE
ncbi:DUF4270 domain-containing protein [uncultured Bacteroides sp.]|uniref:DUF4270 domain-containing protein n=1 Tax=uncultured Bacteroides sp. TaxID=162156 RepID=UPI0026758170|nr:DUF4270 domain-containing protein [uncultured Bacteroides sp.]